MPVTNENELIARAQAGDEQAFAELIRAYNAYVYAIVIGIVNNPLDAEEVVQDIFVNVYRGLAQYEERKKFKSWVAEIARNCARNRLRKQQVDTVPIDEVNEQSSGTEDLPDQQLIRSEQRELIRRAMETLPQKDREIVHSYYLDGASYDELIQTHGLSYKAISVRLARAKQKLSKRLEHLLTGIFVTPATTLKQIYSGGLTVMKIGTAPKITLGAIGLVGLLFIGIGVHHILSSDVPENTPSSVQTEAPSEEVVKKNTNQETENRENQPQISDQDMEQIKGFFAQLEAEDAQSDGGTVQSPTESKAELATTDTDAASEDTEQSAEDVMNAYLDAYKNGDYEALLPLATGSAKAELEGLLRLLNGDGGFLQEAMDNVNIDDILNNIDKEAIPEGMSKAELADRAFQMMPQVMQGMTEMMQEMFSGAEIVSREYVGEEFHFRVSIPMPKIEMPELPKTMKIDMPEMPEIPESIEHLVKMQKVDGAWRIYDTGGK